MTAAHFMLRWKARGGSLWRCWKILGAVATLLPSVWIMQNAVKITVKRGTRDYFFVHFRLLISDEKHRMSKMTNLKIPLICSGARMLR